MGRRSENRAISARMGARFGVTPERPYHRRMFEEGQDAPGIRRVVRRLFPTLRNRSPEQVPAGMSAAPSASGQKPPAAFPVGYAAGGRFRHPSPPPGLMRRRPRPLRPRASGPKPWRPTPDRRPFLTSPSPEDHLNGCPTAFIHTRALLPRSPGERPLFTPGPAHTDTPTPRI